MALPRMATRYRLVRAWATLGEAPDGVDVVALCSAAIGLCWDGHGGPSSTLESRGRDVIRYGEDVLEWLLAHGRTVAAIVAEGRPLLDEIAGSLPREEAVQAAADPSGGTEGSLTPSTSGSASSGSGIPSTSTV